MGDKLILFSFISSSWLAVLLTVKIQSWPIWSSFIDTQPREGAKYIICHGLLAPVQAWILSGSSCVLSYDFLQHQEVQESQRKEHLWQALPRSRLARSCRVTASCWWRLTSRDTQPTQGRPRPGHLHCVPLLTYGLYEENSPDSGSYLNAEIWR